MKEPVQPAVVTPDMVKPISKENQKSLPSALDTALVGALIAEVRTFIGKKATDVPVPAAFEEFKNKPVRQELADNISRLPREQQAALVALMWLGRGDASVSDWSDLLGRALAREGNVVAYLLQHPLLPEYWAEGLQCFKGSSVVAELSGEISPSEEMRGPQPNAPALQAGAPAPDERPPGTRKIGTPDHQEVGRVARKPRVGTKSRH